MQPWKLAAALLCTAAVTITMQAVLSTNSPASPSVLLTYYEEQTGEPSRQQRWYQWMSKQDAGPPIGNLGQGWDGFDRDGHYPGDGPNPDGNPLPSFNMDGSFSHSLQAVQPIVLHTAFKAAKARMTSLDELDHTLTKGSDAYLNAHTYLNQLRVQSVAGQKAYEAKKAAKKAALIAKGMKKAEALWHDTQRNGYGRAITREEFKTLKALNGH